MAHGNATSIALLLSSRDLERREAEHVLPLRFDLYLRAKDEIGGERTRDFDEFLSRNQCMRAMAQGMRVLAGLTAGLEACRTAPWLEAMNLVTLRGVVCLGFFYRHLLRAMATRYGRIVIPAKYDDDATWDHDVGHWNLYALQYAAREEASRGLRIDCRDGNMWDDRSLERLRRRRAAAYRAKAGAGWLLNRWGADVPFLLRKRRGQTSARTLGGRTVVLAGVQQTDVISQTRLAPMLDAKWGDRFLWVHGIPDERLDGGEKTLLTQSRPVRQSIPAASLRSHIWRFWPAKMCSVAHTAWELSRLLAQAGEGLLPATRAWLCELALQVCPTETPWGWRKWKTFFKAVKPAVVIGNSNIFEMAHVAAYCRRTGTPFVQMTHGMYCNSIDFNFAMAGDHPVVHGPLWSRLYRRRPMGQRRPLVAGPLFLRDTLDASGVTRPFEEQSRQRRSMLFLETELLDYPLTGSPAQILAQMLGLGRACGRAGLDLILRPHPRSLAGDCYERIAELLRKDGCACHLDPHRDLVQSLETSSCVVSRVFEGATFKALMLGVPVVCYRPFRGWPASDWMMARFAIMARNEAELSTALVRLHDNTGYRNDVLARQQAFLEDCAQPSCRDGWERVARLVEDLVAAEQGKP